MATVPEPDGPVSMNGLMKLGEVEDAPGLGMLRPGVGSKATQPMVGK